MQRPIPLVKDLVLIGGGHAHALVLRRWAMAPLPGTRLTLVNPAPSAPYTGMLPGHIAGHYPHAALEIDLVRLARHAGARLILGAVHAIDRDDRKIHVRGRPPIRYDVASLDIGVTSDLPDLPGFADHAVAAKPLGDYARRWQNFVETAPADPHVVVIGAGAAGVELALAMAHRLRCRGRSTAQITLVERSASPLPAIGTGARRALLRALDRDGITLIADAAAASVDAAGVTLAGGRRLEADFVLSAAGARPQAWLADTGLALERGFVTVTPFLSSPTDPAIFAVGDCAHLAHAPRPKAGVFAVRAAPVLHHNLRAALGAGRPRRFRPQRDYLKLVSTGGRVAVADKFGLRLEGPLLWRWKDRIDRHFMQRFIDLPAMPQPPLPRDLAGGVLEELAGGKPLCGGCGAKLGASVLRTALAALPPPRRAEVVSGPGDDAAILDWGDTRQVLTTDHLRPLTDDPWLMARIAATHALGDIWAMGAEPQGALLQITLPRAAPAIQADMLTEVMAGAGGVLRAAGADILGGHSAIGDELTIGLSLTGTAANPLGKGGAKAGDALILTKPVGSGTIMAAEMARAAPGAVVAGAWAVMQHPLAPAAAILAPAAHAMTDVTGFGLAGHLLEILDASGHSAILHPARVPIMAGAAELAAAGHRSSLYPANLAATAGRIGPVNPQSAAETLLFDPQTSGGLLAAVPGDRAVPLLERLLAAGETAAIIGTVQAAGSAPRIDLAPD